MNFEELLTYRDLHERDLSVIQAESDRVRTRMNACSDEEIEQLWQLFEDVAIGIFDKNGELLEDADGSDEDPLDESFFLWARGTPRDDVWHWFDQHYGPGLNELQYVKEGER